MAIVLSVSISAFVLAARNSVALLLSWILPISNEEHSAAGVEVAPFNSCNFVLPHCRRDSKSDDTTNGNLLPNVCFQCQDNAIKFVLRGAAVTLIAFSDEPETPKSNPGEIDWLS